MSNRLRSFMLIGIFAVTSLVAEETTENRHTAIGTRAEPVDDQMLRLQKRDEMGVEHEEKSKKIELKGDDAAYYASAPKTYFTTHPGAYQHPVSISFFGDSVELMDGSIWTIASSDAHKTINWFPTDLVVVTPNHSWFSSYGFRLTNQNTGESAAASMFLGPIAPMYHSIYTHWIAGIDYYYNLIYLEDGTVWNMSSFDRNVMDQWMVNDVIIIGVNDGWFSSSNPNILINVNMLNFAAGAVSY